MFKKIFFIILLLCPVMVLAHQPRLVNDENYIKITNPEISQAFYGELSGQPAIYQINQDKPFRLYLGLLVPDIEKIDKDVSMRIYIQNKYQEWEPIYFLDGLKNDWLEFHEDFGNDDYFWGPELKSEESSMDNLKGIEVSGGNYLIEVFSPDNYGKYVLTVGEKEEFVFNDALSSFGDMINLKRNFFNKPVYTVLFTKIFFYLFLIAIVFLVPVIGLLIWFFISRKRRQI